MKCFLSFLILVSLLSCSDSGGSSSDDYEGTWYSMGSYQVIRDDTIAVHTYEQRESAYVPDMKGTVESLGDDHYKVVMTEYYDDDSGSWTTLSASGYSRTVRMEELEEDGVTWLKSYDEDNKLFNIACDDSSVYSYGETYAGKWWCDAVEYVSSEDNGVILWLSDQEFEFTRDDQKAHGADAEFPLIEKGTVTKMDADTIRLDVVYENDGSGFKKAGYVKFYSFDFARSGEDLDLTSNVDRSFGDASFSSGVRCDFIDTE